VTLIAVAATYCTPEAYDGAYCSRHWTVQAYCPAKTCSPPSITATAEARRSCATCGTTCTATGRPPTHDRREQQLAPDPCHA
jgi:hypothetical protein